MPAGKAAGVACVQLDDDLRCRLFGTSLRPAVCSALQPGLDICGASADEAMRLIGALELATQPTGRPTP
jgi:hypothetical protein